MNTTIHEAYDVKDSAYINIDKEINENGSKFKVGDHASENIKIQKHFC